jgi:hypothetical protein
MGVGGGVTGVEVWEGVVLISYYAGYLNQLRGINQYVQFDFT